VFVPDIPTRGARTGGRTGTNGRVASIATAVPWAPTAVVAGVVPVALAAVGSPRGTVTAGGRMAATITRTGRLPGAAAQYIGMAAVPAPLAILAVVTGGSGAAARLGRPPVTGPLAGRAGVVVAP